jgi:signal transduction histidine kinase
MTDISHLLEECVNNVSPLADVIGVTLLRFFGEGIRYPLAPGRFRSIVLNLLGNAIDYNRPQGTVELSCSCNGHGLVLSVKDTGIGVAPEHVPHLFEPFYRADAARRHESGHLGLGLSLVQAHVRAMSGTCRVESEIGKGTTFVIQLPASKTLPKM